MQHVTINQRAYSVEYQRGRFGGFVLTIFKEQRCRGLRGWLGHKENVEVAWLEVEKKGSDHTLCQEHQGIFARAYLEVQPAWQGLGLGTYLLREGIREARKDGSILAGALEGDDPNRLWQWFLKQGMDLVTREDQPGLSWVLARKARAAQASVMTTRLALAEPPRDCPDFREMRPSA